MRACPFWREAVAVRKPGELLDVLPYLAPYDDLRYFSVTPERAIDFSEGIDGFSGYTPILRRYDCREWLAHDYLSRATCGEGTVYLTTLRLYGGMGKQPPTLLSNAFGRWLIDKMLMR